MPLKAEEQNLQQEPLIHPFDMELTDSKVSISVGGEPNLSTTKGLDRFSQEAPENTQENTATNQQSRTEIQMNSPPAKRIRSSSHCEDNSTNSTSITSSMENEALQYNELRRVSISTTLTEASRISIQTQPKHTDANSLPDGNKENLATDRKDSTELSPLESEDDSMMEVEGCSVESPPSHVDQEDFSSIARIVTEQIVTRVSSLQDTIY